MTIYFKNSDFNSDYSPALAVTDSDSTLSLVLTNFGLVNDEGLDAPVIEISIPFSDVKKCDINGVDSSNFVVMVVGRDTNGGTARFSMLPLSSESKSVKPRAFGMPNPIAYIGFDAAATSFSDAVVMAHVSELTVNGTAVTDTVEGFTGLIGKMGSVAISRDGSTISVQTVDADGNNTATSGVEIYLETTVGQLDQTRLTTDANGAASTSITIADGATGKVKAGFKHFSGASEVQI